MKPTLLLIFNLILNLDCFSQLPDSLDSNPTTFNADSAKTVKKWFVPDHGVIQFAGNIGMFSTGPGYTFFNEKLQTDLLYGYVPKTYTGEPSHIITAKFTYNPFQIDKGEKFMLEPLRTGLGVSYHFGEQFHTRWPNRYPDGYYTWQTRYRLTGFIGTAATFKIGNQDRTIKRIQLYAEAGTFDFDFVSYVRDGWVSAWDIISFAIGTKIVL